MSDALLALYLDLVFLCSRNTWRLSRWVFLDLPTPNSSSASSSSASYIALALLLYPDLYLFHQGLWLYFRLEAFLWFLMAVAIRHDVFSYWRIGEMLYLFCKFAEGLFRFLQIGQLESKIGWLSGVLQGLWLEAVRGMRTPLLVGLGGWFRILFFHLAYRFSILLYGKTLFLNISVIIIL